MKKAKRLLTRLKKQVREELQRSAWSSYESSELLAEQALFLSLLYELGDLSLDKLHGNELNELAKIADCLREGLPITAFGRTLRLILSDVRESEQSSERSNMIT